MARMARAVTCSSEEERIVNDIAKSRTGAFSEVQRAKGIPCCLQGMPLSHIAKKCYLSGMSMCMPVRLAGSGTQRVMRWTRQGYETYAKDVVEVQRNREFREIELDTIHHPILKNNLSGSGK